MQPGQQVRVTEGYHDGRFIPKGSTGVVQSHEPSFYRRGGRREAVWCILSLPNGEKGVRACIEVVYLERM